MSFAVATAVSAGGSVLAPAGTPRLVFQALLPLVTAAATVVGPKLQPHESRRGLRAITFAMLTAATSCVLMLPSWPWAEHPALEPLVGGLSLLILALIVVSAFRLTARRVEGRKREFRIDTALVVIATATVLYDLVALPAMARAPDEVTRATLAMLPLVQAPVVAACFRLLATGGHRLPSAWFMSGAATWGLGAMMVAAFAGSPELPTSAQLLLAISTGFIVAAVLHPSYARVGVPDPRPDPWAVPLGRLSVIGLALLAIPATMLRAADSATSVPAIGAMACAALVLWRMTGLVLELNRRSKLESALSALGHSAVESRTTSEFLDQARSIIGSVTDGRWSITDVGEPVAVDLRGHVDAQVSTFLETTSDLARAALRRWAAEAELNRRALHDPLTGLPNRTLTLDRLATCMTDARSSREPVGVLFIDLDRFKAVNDELGHAAGDEVLVAVAERLTSHTRDGDTVARLAGDEFVVIAPRTDEPTAHDLAARLRVALSAPYDTTVGAAHLGASIGTTVTNGTGDAESVLRTADQQMYRDKRRRVGSFL